MTFLSYQCVEYFRTEGSISFVLSMPMPSTELPVYLKNSRANMVVGYLDFHYPSSGHIKAYMRVMLKNDLAAEIEPGSFESRADSSEWLGSWRQRRRCKMTGHLVGVGRGLRDDEVSRCG